MNYKLLFSQHTKKDLKSLDKSIQKFILDSLDDFIKNFNSDFENELIKTQKIKVLKGEWSGFYRLRLRSYRVIYEKQENLLIIHIVRISHRKDVYS